MLCNQVGLTQVWQTHETIFSLSLSQVWQTHETILSLSYKYYRPSLSIPSAGRCLQKLKKKQEASHSHICREVRETSSRIYLIKH